MTPFASHKYHAKRTVVDGVAFPSKAEAARYSELLLMEKAGAIRGFIRQPVFCLGVPENKYRADFLVFDLDGSTHTEDVKGMSTAKFNRDKKLWAKYGPNRLSIITRGRVVEVIASERMGGRP